VPVKLKSLAASELSVLSGDNGEFAFRRLSLGSYIVIAEGGGEFESIEEPVFLEGDYTMMLQFKRRRDRANESKPAVINAAALAEPPEAARKLYKKAMGFAQAGDSKNAIKALESAISIFPNFVLALNELGVQYLKLGQPNLAIESLTSAHKLTPDDFRTNLNLGIALLETNQLEAAEARLIAALKYNQASPTAHMYLGLALMSQKKWADSRMELEKAAASGSDQVAKAHYYLGGIHWGNREYNRAADELETYLKLVPNAPDAKRIHGTIEELRSKQDQVLAFSQP
jgi:tetratricopeptide (TPR) repeat protein